MKILGNRWSKFQIDSLFDVFLPTGDIKADECDEGMYPLITAQTRDNGVIKYIAPPDDRCAQLYSGNMITLDMFGSARFQPKPFFCVSHGRVNILKPFGKWLDRYTGLFVCVIIEKEKYRFNYGRACYSSFAKKMKIILPVDDSGAPAWSLIRKFMQTIYQDYITKYIKSLPHGDCL